MKNFERQSRLVLLSHLRAQTPLPLLPAVVPLLVGYLALEAPYCSVQPWGQFLNGRTAERRRQGKGEP
jgi:hypothetical protein